MSVTTKNEVDPESTFYGDKTILVAKTGYGKSYTARVLIEEGVKKGNTFIVIDPQDAYKNIPDFEYIDAADVKSVKDKETKIKKDIEEMGFLIVANKEEIEDTTEELAGLLMKAKIALSEVNKQEAINEALKMK